MRRVMIQADDNLLDRAQRAARERGVTFPQLVRDALERELARQGLAFFTYRVAGAPRLAQGTASLGDLVEAGVLVPEPIVYEDFLPRSAAGIFQSNLTVVG